MRSERLGHRAWLLLFLRLNLLEEADERLRIVPGLVHILHAQVVGFRFKVALELHEGQRQSQTRRLIDPIANPSAHENQGEGPELCHICACQLTHLVPRANVRNFMRHHAGQFRLFIGRQDQAGIHIKKAARQRERIDLVGIDHLDRERHLRVRIPHQVLPDPVDVLIHERILNQLHAALDFHRVLLANLDLGLKRVPVADAAPADFAVANRIHIVFAAGMLHLAGVRLLYCLRRRCIAGVACGVRGILRGSCT